MVNEEYYEAKMGEEEPLVVESPDMGFVEGVGPCMGIGILNKEKKREYLVHLDPWGNYRKIFEKALEETEDMGNLEIVLVGNTPSPLNEIEGDEIFKDTLQASIKYKKKLLKYIDKKDFNKKRLKIFMPEKPSNDVYGIEIDTQKNKIKANCEEILTFENE